MSSFTSLFATAALLALSFNLSAQVRPRPRPFPPAPTPIVENREIRLIEEVNRFYTGVSTIALRELFRLDQSYRGFEVLKVELQAQSNFGRAQAQLVVNGRDEGFSQTIDDRRSIMSFDLPSYSNVIGETLQSFQLSLRGQVQVVRVAVTLAPVQRLEVVESDYRQWFRGNNLIPVRQILGLGGIHNGKKLEFVELTASSSAGRAQALLVINGQNAGLPQIIDNWTSTVRFEVPASMSGNILGRDIQTVELRIVGNVTTQSIAAGVIAQGRGPVPPRPIPLPSVQEREPNILVTGQQLISLSSILDDARYAHRRVSRVEITGRSRDGFGRVSVCESAYDCGFAQTLNRGQTFTSHYVSGATLQSLQINAQGYLMIQKVVIHFE